MCLDIRFVSLLQYAPRGTTAMSQMSRTVTYKVKSDGFIGSTRVIAHAARRVAEHLDAYAFLQDCFGSDVTLVPLPRGAVLDAQDFCGLLSASVQACLSKALAARSSVVWHEPGLSLTRRVRPRASDPTRQTIMPRSRCVPHDPVRIPTGLHWLTM